LIRALTAVRLSFYAQRRYHRCFRQRPATPKKVGSLPVAGDDELKRTNEIKMAIPLLDAIDIGGKDITADALLTQQNFADYLVRLRHAHYHFTVKKTSPLSLLEL
jgi:hypothetical protein